MSRENSAKCKKKQEKLTEKKKKPKVCIELLIIDKIFELKESKCTTHLSWEKHRDNTHYYSKLEYLKTKNHLIDTE